MNRTTWLCGVGVLAAAALARADGPATRPAPLPPPDVYVAPFHPLGGEPQWAWVGRAVQENLVSDLARAGRRPTIGPDGTAADPVATDPVATARAAGARFAVVGTYQWTDPMVRFDGQLLDAATGRVVGGLSATGDARDLFGLEDALSAQLVHQLSRPPTAAPVVARPVPAALQPAAVAAAIQPPPAAAGSTYDGSALQAYVDANRTPSTDYDQQVANVRDNNTFGSYNNYGGAYGFGSPFAGAGYGGLSYGYGGYSSVAFSTIGFGGGFGGYGFHGGGFGSHGGFGGGRR